MQNLEASCERICWTSAIGKPQSECFFKPVCKIAILGNCKASQQYLRAVIVIPSAGKYIFSFKECIQNIHKRFSTKRNSQKKKENPVDVFGDDFEAFFAWWCEKTPEDGIRRCCYCEVDEKALKDAFDLKSISSKKRSFSGELQIERKDPDGDYCDSNCEFACVICNNAKSDMISAEDFTKFFVPGIKEYWEHIEEKIKKKNP